MEEAALYSYLTHCMDPDGPDPGYSACDDCEHEANGFVGRTALPFMRCPSAPAVAAQLHNWNLENLAKGNYAGNFGADTYLSFQSRATAGVFGVVDLGTKFIKQGGPDCPVMGRVRLGYGKGIKLKDVTDGTTHTLLVSEVVATDTSADARGTWVVASAGASAINGKTTPNSTTNDVLAMCDTTIPATDPPHCTQNQKDGNIFAAPRSLHPGGVMTVFADGSTHFEPDSIDPATWTALTTIAGGETISGAE
jgi:hypothetical protein